MLDKKESYCFRTFDYQQLVSKASMTAKNTEHSTCDYEVQPTQQPTVVRNITAYAEDEPVRDMGTTRSTDSVRAITAENASEPDHSVTVSSASEVHNAENQSSIPNAASLPLDDELTRISLNLNDVSKPKRSQNSPTSSKQSSARSTQSTQLSHSRAVSKSQEDVEYRRIKGIAFITHMRVCSTCRYK